MTVLTASGLDAVGGITFAIAEHLPVYSGLYWAVTTATTVGYGDITPHTTLGHVIAVLVMLTVIPLFAATFSLFTSGLTESHVVSSEDRIAKRIEQHTDQLKRHIERHAKG